ncbi:winged helix-turn-helix domain-containing protein [Occallatibacter savannae]|uniref:winged helix-turn-helix domain-containing protein n=1 Tax=Occallatibacter savannae TaxID=1002691 RepID=UPI000D68FF02|nr:winged helix-turn-helix domain-containing protein [Occallatibacter savannae]
MFQFGDFELDCARFQLSRKGRALRIERKPMELLMLLVTRRAQLVTRAEIAEKLWPKDVFVDTDHGINTAVRKLRQLLKDDADIPVYIQTVTRMGYRFIAPVESDCEVQTAHRSEQTEPIAHANSSPEALVPKPAAAPVSVPKPSARWGWISAMGLLSVFGALFAGRLHRTDFTPMRITHSLQLTSDGREKFPMVATDGVRVYFAEVVNGHWALSAVPVAGGEPVALPLPFADAQLLSISPDRSDE